ncbi:hypothetical protein DID88_001198 [Monilinia fructigena]|uniref:C3H1-type domain-containing protein n=1 Tax=Monilinia fructigena TaxID=38457 RepID=A0A395IY56_9HELO|nr:hypothetical protein DID88_001198 [Monilinia fructigena]
MYDSNDGKGYFECLSKAPTPASFIRPTRKPDPEQSFVEAVFHKYASGDAINPEKQIVISGKVAEEVGFDKIAEQQARIYATGTMTGSDAVKTFTSLVFNKKLSYIDLSSNKINDWGFVDELVHIFPGMTSLRLSKNPLYPESSSLSTMGSLNEESMLTLARLGNLQKLNFSSITPQDRNNAELFYLSEIGKELGAVESIYESIVLSRHKRYKELCDLHGPPVVARKEEAEINPAFLEARLIKFTFYIPAKLGSDQTETTLVKEIPKTFNIYRVKGIVGRFLACRPWNLRLIWETGEWDPVAGFEDVDEYSSDEDKGVFQVDQIVGQSHEQSGKFMKREVELEDTTKDVGLLVNEMQARTDMSVKPSKRDVSARNAKARRLSVSTRDLSPQGPRPGHFIVRKSGEVVPLVAVDELPLGVDLIGVPRSLDLVETGGMLNLGLQGGEGVSYRLVGLEEDYEDGNDNSGRNMIEIGSSGPDTAVSSPLLLPIRYQASVSPASKQTKTQSSKLQSFGLSASIYAPSPSPTTTRINQNTTPSSGHKQTQQQTCRHWCTHNRRCKWGEDCHYKHEMPRTRFELGLIGLNDWPRWFKAENLGFFPKFVNGSSGGRSTERLRNLGGGMERKERDRGEKSAVVRDGREKSIGMGILEGERVLERLRDMEKLLRVKRAAAGKGRDRDERKGEGRVGDEKKTREKEREEILDIRKADMKKERERMRDEKIREKEATGKIDRCDLEEARKWEDESEDISEDECKGEKKRENGKGTGVEKEKLVDV